MVTNYSPSRNVVVTTSGKVLGGVLKVLSKMTPAERTELLRLSASDNNPAPAPSFESMLPVLREKGMVR